MSDLERDRLELITSLLSFDRAAQECPSVEPVLPEDVDLEDELGRCFAEIGP